jgi:ATPase family associated with various cellular activities (AAA)
MCIMAEQESLFDGTADERAVDSGTHSAPLADRLRPKTLAEVVGQRHLVGPGRPLRVALETGRLHSMILWGPPGVGKTTIARLVAHLVDAQFIVLSAVLSGVKEIRDAVAVRGQQILGAVEHIAARALHVDDHRDAQRQQRCGDQQHRHLDAQRPIAETPRKLHAGSCSPRCALAHGTQRVGVAAPLRTRTPVEMVGPTLPPRKW